MADLDSMFVRLEASDNHASHDAAKDWWDAYSESNRRSDLQYLWSFFRHARALVRRSIETGEAPQQDRCPRCLSTNWGRSRGEDHSQRDFTRRTCSDCGQVRDEPKDDG